MIMALNQILLLLSSYLLKCEYLLQLFATAANILSIFVPTGLVFQGQLDSWRIGSLNLWDLNRYFSRQQAVPAAKPTA